MTITLFSWGYSGWGNHTPRLVEAVDAVEASRGFEPPLFVDIRIHRSVRAAGFNGAAFEKLLGEERYRWMKSLGNRAMSLGKKSKSLRRSKSVKTGKGGHDIADPEAANELLDLAIRSAEQRRRVIFFCSCPWPGTEKPCHRSTVAGLVLKAARKRGIPVEIVEWPGGEPKRIKLDITPTDFASVRDGRMTVPLDQRIDLVGHAGMPWGSIATLRAGGEQLHRVVGPAIWKKGRWALPVLLWFFDPATGLGDYQKGAEKARKDYGLEPARV